jgi:Flp pilus assembly protein TadG
VVELAVVLPLMIMMLLGIWEIGRLVQIHQAVSNAAREAARQASAGLRSNAEIEQVARDYLRGAGLSVNNLQITITNHTQSGTPARSANQMDQFRIRVSLPFANVRWMAIDTFVQTGHRLEADAVWYCMKDKEFPDPADPAIE